MKTRDKVKVIIAETFNIPVVDMSDNITQSEISSWDSLGHLRLILTIEEKLDLRFNMEDIPTLVSLDLITEAVDKQSK